MNSTKSGHGLKSQTSNKNSENEFEITDWKRIWQLVSGIHYSTPKITVKETLFEKSKEIQDGLLQFEKSKPSSADDLEKLLKSLKQEKLLHFATKLQHILDLQPNQCWEILCYYLSKEYRGTANSLPLLTSTESNMTKLLEDIWGYYSLERMIFLKLVKNILQFYDNSYHPYHTEYKEILDKITLSKLKKSYLDQLEYLVKENPPTKLTSAEFWNYQVKLVDWNERNCREVVEILHILLLIIHYDGITSDELKRLMECFKINSFGRQQRFLNESNEIHSQLITKICYSEVVLFLRCVDLSQGEIDNTWVNDVVNKLDKDINSMQYSPASKHHTPEYGPLLLSWMLLNFRVVNCNEDDMALRKYRQYGGRAIQLDVFNFLSKIVANQMFEDNSLVAIIARKSIFNHLSHLCDLFDEDGSVGKHNGVYDLLNKLLTTSSIAAEFSQNEESGVRSLYNTALENFPIDFVNISETFLSLAKAGQADFVKNEAEILPIYAEYYDECKHKLQAIGNDEYILLQRYLPFRGIEYFIEPETSAAILSHTNGAFVHFRTPINFFNVLHNEINLLLSEAIQYIEIDERRIKRVNSGIKYLAFAISKIDRPEDIPAEMVFPTEMCLDILNKFKNVPNPPIELLANCLNVCSSLLRVFKLEISSRITNLNILPFVSNESLEFSKYAHGVCFDSNLVGTYLINFERKIEKYDFLMAYLNYLRRYTSINTGDNGDHNNLFQVEIPGLIFLLREVFPHIHSWRFRTQLERNKIYQETLEFFCDVLDIIVKTKSDNNSKQVLRDICVYNLLNSDNGIVLLKILAIGNPFLQSSMEMESNWLTSSSSGIIRLVRLSMRILMHLLRLKSTIFPVNTLSPLESLIYTQPRQRDTLRIIPIVTSYMNNIFDRSLPILSCRLLRRIALEFKMSLLACLDMEADQIRLIFLQSLPDDLESDDLKVAILEFVEACIEKQPGLTESFFKINSEKEKRIFAPKREFNIAESIVTFMEIYLASVSDTPEIIENEIPIRIMTLFHALWKNNKQSLVDNLMKNKTFWPSLCSPLFGKDLKTKIKAYSQIFNIMGIEIFITNPESNINENLQKVLERFFEKNYFEKWLIFVFDLPMIKAEDCVPDETSEWLSRLQSFKEFMLIILKKKIKDYEVPNEQMRTLAIKCLDILVVRAEYTDDLRPFLVLAELYLIALHSFKHSYTENVQEDQDMLQKITKLLSNLSICYEDLHVRAKEACLSIGIKAADLLSTELIKDIHDALNFLYPIVNIICCELGNLERSVRVEIKQSSLIIKNDNNDINHQNTTTERNTSLVLSLNLLKTVASIFHDKGPANWDTPFHANRVFNRLLSCTSWILQLSSKQKLSIELLDVLIVFAKGNCSNEFLFCDIGDYLWLKLIPPKELLQAPYMLQQSLPQTKSEKWILQKWWPIYSRGIELLTILLHRHRHQFLKDILQFVGIHEEFLMDSLLLAKQSLEPNALILIKNTVDMIALLSEFENEWRLEHSQSLFNIRRCVQCVLGHSVSLFNQQKNLKRLMLGLNMPIDPIKELSTEYYTEDLVTILNDLTEIIIISAKCLLNFSPNLLDLICSPQFLICKWEPLFDIQFGPPKLNDPSNQLTFGTVLNIVGIFTKALNLQSYDGFHEIPLNEIPDNINDQSMRSISSAEKSISTPPDISSSRKNFSKSMSVASVTSSVTAPPNELLSNLDGELCQMALENVLTLIACQSLLALKNSNLSNREKQLIRREITTELLTYHEFVRKKVLNDSREYRNIWHRKKRGIFMMTIPGSSDNLTIGTKTSSDQSLGRHSGSKPSMRVDVVRRQHLQNQQQYPVTGSGSSKQNFNMSVDISPISKQKKKSDLNIPSASTPNLGRPPIRKAPDDNDSIKVVCTEEDDENENDIQLLEPVEPKYTPLSYVVLVEEDYLHFLSNIFHVICQSD